MDYILILGQISLFAIILAAIGFMIASVFFMLALFRRNFLLPNLAAMLITAFESPLKVAVQLFGGSPDKVTEIIIEARNLIFYRNFVRTPYNERAIIVPQCIRNVKCPAKLDAYKGIECLDCGLCRIKEIRKKAKELGYKVVSVSPGGTFSKRIIRMHKPRAVIGVACGFELQEGYDACIKYGIIGQGIPLLRGGCINSLLDYERLFELMEAYAGPTAAPAKTKG